MKLETKFRFVAGLSMAALFISILLSGRNDLVVLFLTAIQAKVFHELRQVKLSSSLVHHETLQIISDWILFSVFMSFSLNLIYTPKPEKVLIYHFLSYITWFAFWVWLILDARTSNLGQYLLHSFWIHVAVLYTVIQPVIINLNIQNGGIFWFLFPCSLIIMNDTAAYLCGSLFGKRKLLNLSPKKTVEGFSGACIVTVLFGYKFSAYLAQFDSLINHQHPLVYREIQYHGMILALFASTFAPFGGYFASALKRAGNIKDFGNWIPGHGGLTDRMDCQLFMAVFTFVYFKYITT